MSKTLRWLISILCLILVLVTACAGNTSNTQSTTATSSTIATTASVNTSSGPQVLRVNINGEPETIDPNRASWSTERTPLTQVFEGLLAFNPDLTLRPDTALEIPTVANGGISTDGLTYTFKLNPKVTWSDGQKVTAKDYVYSIKRELSPDVAAAYASFYFDIAGGAEYFNSGSEDAATQASLRDKVGVTALDDYTLQIKLASPRPTFLDLMALWPVFPIREDIVNKFGDKWTEPPNFIGDGPFILTEWVHQDHMTFKQNPNYWGDKPALTEIRMTMMTDLNALLAAYRNNEVDVCFPVPSGTQKSLMADPVLSKEILRYPQLITFGWQFNVKNPPFDNVKVRQAIASAYDRSAYIDQVLGGVGKPAVSWIPPGMPGYDASLGQEYQFNPARAKQLLAEAGYSDVSKLPPIKLQYVDTSANATVSQFLQAQLKDNLGISLTLEPMEAKAFTQSVNAHQFDMAWFGWGADYPDPDNWLPEIFGTNGGNNKTQYSNPQFDALAAQAAVELDNTKRLQLWAQAAKIVSDDCPAALMNYREVFALVKPYVKGLTGTGMDGDVPGDMFLSDVSIQK